MVRDDGRRGPDRCDLLRLPESFRHGASQATYKKTGGVWHKRRYPDLNQELPIGETSKGSRERKAVIMGRNPEWHTTGQCAGTDSICHLH